MYIRENEIIKLENKLKEMRRKYSNTNTSLSMKIELERVAQPLKSKLKNLKKRRAKTLKLF